MTETVWPLVNPSMVRLAPAFPPVRPVMVPSLKGQVEVGAAWITRPVDPAPAPTVMARGSNVTVSSCVSLPIELVPATRLYPGDAGRVIDERYATAALRR